MDIAVPASPGASRPETFAIGSPTRALVLAYVIASTVLFGVGGVLGMILRQSQGHLVDVDSTVWYELMTAHGLATFVGWGAFCLMGLSYWILEECGFPIVGWARRFAGICWWTMVVGVAGIVAAVLHLHFAGSWVALYPLPFSSVGQWGDGAAALFAGAVLLAGVSILAYCCAILAAVTGPGLKAPPDASFVERLGTAMALGLLRPGRFRSAEPVPYPIVPLTVIGIDMIIATIPFAGLLVEMLLQAADPSITIDPLLAKTLLWWFGHPVVYLLLFPAVAVYYHLVPRYAGRPLVAGHILAVAWSIAVVANVVIGAHHMYTDFPEDIQRAVNTWSQPVTYAVTIPSAISLFSLAFTVYRSEFRWTVPARFLAAALASWLVAGFQGVGLATIQFDVVAHNTLWVVGHFHNMALLHIGMVIFAGVYAFLPAIVGRAWWSERRLPNWHLVLTLIGGYGMVVPWMLEGAYGAPRRWAVLPARFDGTTELSLVFVLILALGQLPFFVNLAMTLRRGDQAAPEPIRVDRIAMPEEGREVGASLLGAASSGLGILGFAVAPFLWGPVAVVGGLFAGALGARGQAALAVGLGLVATLLGVVGLL